MGDGWLPAAGLGASLYLSGQGHQNLRKGQSSHFQRPLVTQPDTANIESWPAYLHVP